MVFTWMLLFYKEGRNNGGKGASKKLKTVKEEGSKQETEAREGRRENATSRRKERKEGRKKIMVTPLWSTSKYMQ